MAAKTEQQPSLKTTTTVTTTLNINNGEPTTTYNEDMTVTVSEGKAKSTKFPGKYLKFEFECGEIYWIRAADVKALAATL